MLVSLCISPLGATGNLIIGIKDHEAERSVESQNIPSIGNVSRIDLTIKSVQVHYKGPQEDIQIEAKINADEGTTKVSVDINDTESKFTLNTTDTSQIISQTAERTGLSIEKVQSVIEIQKEEAEIHEANETEIDRSSGWTTIFEGSKTFNLLEFTGNFTGVLGEQSLQPGKYEQIRLFIENASITVNGQTFDLIVPSNVLKVVEEFQVESNKTTLLILDFDVNKSIKREGNKYILRPTIKIMELKSDKKEHQEIEDETGEQLEEIKSD